MTQNSLSFQGPICDMLSFKSVWLADGRGMFLCSHGPRLRHSSPSCITSLTNASLNCQYDNSCAEMGI